MLPETLDVVRIGMPFPPVEAVDDVAFDRRRGDPKLLTNVGDDWPLVEGFEAATPGNTDEDVVRLRLWEVILCCCWLPGIALESGATCE